MGITIDTDSLAFLVSDCARLMRMAFEKRILSAGLGLTVAPAMTTRYLRDGVDSIALDELSTRRILLCRLDQRKATPATDAMRSVLLGLFAAMNST